MYDRAQAVAEARGENLSELIRGFLRDYAEEGERAHLVKSLCGETNPRRKTMPDNGCIRTDLHNGRHCDGAGFEWHPKATSSRQDMILKGRARKATSKGRAAE